MNSVRTSGIVALATYNEIENLPELVDEILRALPDADVLVVDDNSPDGTGRWCDERANASRGYVVLHRPAKLGLGTATLAAAERRSTKDYSVLVTLDADGSHDPRHLRSLSRDRTSGRRDWFALLPGRRDRGLAAGPAQC